MNLLLRGLKGNLSVMVAERYKLLHRTCFLFSEGRLNGPWKHCRRLLIWEGTRNREQIVFPWRLLEISCSWFSVRWEELGDVDHVNWASVGLINKSCSLIIQCCTWGIWKIISWWQRSLLHRERLLLEWCLMFNIYHRVLTYACRFPCRLTHLTLSTILRVHPLYHPLPITATTTSPRENSDLVLPWNDLLLCLHLPTTSASPHAVSIPWTILQIIFLLIMRLFLNRLVPPALLVSRPIYLINLMRVFHLVIGLKVFPTAVIEEYVWEHHRVLAFKGGYSRIVVVNFHIWFLW